MTTKSFPQWQIKNPEIVIGIVSPVGTALNTTIDALKEELEGKDYAVHHIKITDHFPKLAEIYKYSDLKPDHRYERIDTYITFGNVLRNTLGGEALAAYAAAQIVTMRSADKGTTGNAFIIDQLKTEDELLFLRDLYGTSFFQVSVYSARDVRVHNLSKLMAHDNNKRDANSFRHLAEKLVVRDEDEFNEPNGQKVGKIFQLADLVINDDRVEDNNTVGDQVARFIELMFGHNGYSPNRLEYGMYLAHSAALRSLDLSRQVGAAIFRKTGEIACLGANEVPRAGGGTYWADECFDAREYKVGEDSNDERKKELLDEVIGILRTKTTLSDEELKKLRKSQFMDALEYGRIIHAEMSAISDAARLGISLQDATLYCTTFPCHMCSKHIVSSGIAKVVFLEPYPKSLTSDLHSDSVEIEGTSRGPYTGFPSVEFVPFFGITPRRYREFFYRTKRKNEGAFEKYKGGESQPIFNNTPTNYLDRETAFIQFLKDRMEITAEAFGKTEIDQANTLDSVTTRRKRQRRPPTAK